MNEILLYVESVSSGGWAYFLAVLAVAAGFLLLDRRPVVSQRREERRSEDQLAA